MNYNEEMKVTAQLNCSNEKKIWLHVRRLSWKKMYNKKNQRKITTKQNKRVIAEISCVPTARKDTHTHAHSQIKTHTHEQQRQQNKRTICAPLERQTANPLSPSLPDSLSEQLNSCEGALSFSLFLLAEAICLYMVRFHFVLVPLCLIKVNVVYPSAQERREKCWESEREAEQSKNNNTQTLHFTFLINGNSFIPSCIADLLICIEGYTKCDFLLAIKTVLINLRIMRNKFL